MNYRHIYHAGGFSDVFKHIVLVMLLEHLLQKDKPFVYFDTHAGIGSYDLTQSEARKTMEYESGIMRLIEHDNEKAPEVVHIYLNILRIFNEDDFLSQNRYPGSPAIAQILLRKNDRMILSELHAKDCQKLKEFFADDPRAVVHCMDGYQAVKAFIPPNPNRGLVFIDPPYESMQEYEDLKNILKLLHKHWVNGMIAIWYPVTKDLQKRKQFIAQFKNSKFKSVLQAELNVYPPDSPMGINGSGMLIINPPYQLFEQLKTVMPGLWKILSPEGFGSQFVQWIKTE